MNGNTKVYGIKNCAFFNVRATGDESWFATAEERDEAMAKMRGRAEARGLSATACSSGIYAVENRWSKVRNRSGVGVHMSLDLAAEAVR